MPMVGEIHYRLRENHQSLIAEHRGVNSQSCDHPPSAGSHRGKHGDSVSPAQMTVLSPLRCSKGIHSLTRRSLLSRESESFGTLFRQAESTGESFFRVLQMDREPETSGEFAVESKIPRKTGSQWKTPRGTLSAFSVNLAVGGSSLTEFSSSGRTRTYDPAVNSRLLYQLSYRGMSTPNDYASLASARSRCSRDGGK